MPAGNIDCFERSLVIFSVEDTVISKNAVRGRGEIRVSVETRIKKSDRHAAAGEAFVGVKPQRRRQDITVLLKHSRVRIELALGATEERDAVGADPGYIAAGSSIGFHH